jgi:hypothetical protein
MTKTVIYNLPPLDQTKPPLSGAILGGICTKLGHKIIARDLQLNLLDFLNKNCGIKGRSLTLRNIIDAQIKEQQ